MDNAVAGRATDVLGRRTGPRRKYTVAEKRAIVEETKVKGASVADVAQRHGINANLVFGWRRLFQQGLLKADAAVAASLVPVKITTPTVIPAERVNGKAASRPRHRQRDGVIEIEFAGGIRVRVHGGVDRATLARVLDVLSSR